MIQKLQDIVTHENFTKTNQGGRSEGKWFKNCALNVTAFCKKSYLIDLVVLSSHYENCQLDFFNKPDLGAGLTERSTLLLIFTSFFSISLKR